MSFERYKKILVGAKESLKRIELEKDINPSLVSSRKDNYETLLLFGKCYEDNVNSNRQLIENCDSLDIDFLIENNGGDTKVLLKKLKEWTLKVNQLD